MRYTWTIGQAAFGAIFDTHILVSDIAGAPAKFNIPAFPFDADRAPPLTKPGYCNDALRMTSFPPSRTVWAGEQRKETPFNIPDARPHSDHVYKSLEQPCHLADHIPIPEDPSGDVHYIRDTPNLSIPKTIHAHLKAVKDLVSAVRPTQLIWGAASPPALQPTSGRIAPVALVHLLSQYGMGGSRWARQFVLGFDAIGGFSQKSLSPHGPGVKSQSCPDSPLFGAAERSGVRLAALDLLIKIAYGRTRWIMLDVAG